MVGLSLLAVLMAAPPAFSAISFNRDIRPIMSNTCFHCHGPDKNSRMAGLRLDRREEAVKPTASGATPIVPGDPDNSAIIQRVFASNAKIMPPAYAHKELTPKQKNTLRQWVSEGAKYEGHWAYQPVTSPAVPALSGPTVRNPIDAFIQTRLAAEGLKPAPEADRRTLLRRLHLDLTGIPPSPAEVDGFLKDTSPDAYEKTVDRLLDSERYAERQAIYWLDAVRYADTCGFHGDNPFPAWPYRDYVLRAFRDNKPFDVFTREQLAGDLLADAGVEQKIASAYNRMNRTSAEGGIQPKEYLAKYGADRVRTTATVWLGSTMGCSECHDHKFDPFTARDFYSFKAFFADIKETGLVPDRGPKAWGSQLELPDDAQKARIAELKAAVEAAHARYEAETARLYQEKGEAWEKQVADGLKQGTYAWRFQRPVSAQSANGATLKIYNDEPVESNSYIGSTMLTESRKGNGLIIASGEEPDNDTYTVTFRPGAGRWTALGLEVVQDESLPGIRVARGSDRLIVTEIEAELGGRKLPFSLATASFTGISPELPAMAAIDGKASTGWGVATYGENRNLFLALRFATPLETTAEAGLTLRIRHDSEFRKATIGRFRIALSDAAYSWPDPEEARRRRKNANADGVADDVASALAAEPAKRTEAQQKTLREALAWFLPEAEQLVAELARLEGELGMAEAAVPRVVVTEATDPEPTRILARGNFMDESGEIVEPAIPAFLGRLDTDGRRATRLDLANWLISKNNPLTPRVWVNRQWRQLFGTGLSKVLDDLGSQGETPVHPELLDWLANEFRQDWDMRKIVRLMVTSHTYRQSSMVAPGLEERDPDNRLLARQTRARVDAEIVRDVALSVSGLLTETFGGPSVRPYQPEGYLAALNFPKRDYSASRGGDLYRRGLYTVWQRSFLHPSIVTFDAPTREECTVNRVSSNTPLQALVLLNDPIFVEAARVFGARILKEGGATQTSRINYAFEVALNRRPSPTERTVLLKLYRTSLARFTAAPAEAKKLLGIGEAPVDPKLGIPQLAAAATVARTVLNLHETITRY